MIKKYIIIYVLLILYYSTKCIHKIHLSFFAKFIEIKDVWRRNIGRLKAAFIKKIQHNSY